MVEYYKAAYEMYNFRKPFGEGDKDSVVISVKINKFKRCHIGSEIFGSSMLSCHVKSSFILAKLIGKLTPILAKYNIFLNMELIYRIVLSNIS